MTSEFLALGILVLVWILYYKYKRNKMSKLVLPPGPRPWPVVGNLGMLGNLPHQALAALAKKYGPIMYLRLGSVPTVVISSPAMAKEFFKTHDLVFANRPNCLTGKYLCYDHKDMAYAPYGDYWRQIKKLCTLELLTAKRTDSFKSVREEEVMAMVRSIWDDSGRGLQCVDISLKLGSLTQNIICRMFAGTTYSDHKLIGGHSFKQMIDELFVVAGAFCIGDFIPSLSWLDLQGYRRRMKKVHKIYDEFLEKVIEDHIDRRKRKGNFNGEMKGEDDDYVKDMVDVMLDMAEFQSQTTQIQINRVHMKAIILDMLNAGVETSSTTLAWGLSELLKNSHILVKAQCEIESVVGKHRRVTEHDLESLEYLRCIVKETFRLHPPVPFLIPHESMEDCNVEGYYIPAKTRLFLNLWAMGRDASVWEDPLEFNPERFMGKNIDVRGQSFELLPFGTGRRGCPAILMGLCVVELALAQLLHCFDWSVEGEINMEEVFGMTLPKKIHLFARPQWKLIADNV